MTNDERDHVLTTQEACRYLRISRPTYLKCLYSGKIKGTKVGKGWKVLKSELDRFLKEGTGRQRSDYAAGQATPFQGVELQR